MRRPVAFVEVAHGDALRARRVDYLVVTYEDSYVVDATAAPLGGEENQVALPEVAAVDASTEIGLFACRPWQFYACDLFEHRAGKSRAVDTLAAVAAVAIRGAKPSACSVNQSVLRSRRFFAGVCGSLVDSVFVDVFVDELVELSAAVAAHGVPPGVASGDNQPDNGDYDKQCAVFHATKLLIIALILLNARQCKNNIF